MNDRSDLDVAEHSSSIAWMRSKVDKNKLY